MIGKIGRSIRNNKTIFENFFSLSVLQAAGYLLPLITLPYLVRVLGPDKFGLVAFAQSFVAYFTLITDYGFNLSATKEISINRHNPGKISGIFCAVYAVKFLLLLLSSMLFILLVLLIPRFKSDHAVFLFAYILVLGNCFFPVWLFQGMEKMKYIAAVNVVIKALFIVPVFIFVKSEADYIYAPLINSLGFLASGAAGFVIAVKIFRIRLLIPDKARIIHQLKDGWHIFISTIAVSLYTVSNTFILGLFANNIIVGYYSAAEKIVKAVQGLVGPVSQAVYPHISKLASESREKAIAFIGKLLRIMSPATILMSLLLFIFADKIVMIVLGAKYAPSVLIMKILSFLPFIVGLSNIFGIQTLLTFNYKKEFSRVLVSCSILSVISAVILVNLFRGTGIAFNVLATELVITAWMYAELRMKKIKLGLFG